MLPEQIERLDSQIGGKLFDGSEAEIAEALLDAADVGPVVAELLGELLLAEPDPLPVSAEVATERALQVTFHANKATRRLLMGLQTYK